jgi:hypothetical protein
LTKYASMFDILKMIFAISGVSSIQISDRSSRYAAKSGSTGLFERVELKIAKSPVPQNQMNGRGLTG